MIEVSEEPIDVAKVIESVRVQKAGAIAPFIGTVRREKGIEGLFYECYPDMALPILKEIARETKKRWPVEQISIVHRYGWVDVGEPSVVIAVSSGHRGEAFEACRFVIDQIKSEVPIWKR